MILSEAMIGHGGIRIQCPPCIHCGQAEVISITNDQLNPFLDAKNGRVDLRAAFPDWPKEKIETVMSGIHPACWQEMFAGMEDEE